MSLTMKVVEELKKTPHLKLSTDKEIRDCDLVKVIQDRAYESESDALDCFAALEKVSKDIMSKSHPSPEVSDVIDALEELLPVRVRGKWRALQEKLIWWAARYPQLRESKEGKRLSLMCDEDTVSIRHIAPQDVANHFNIGKVTELFEDPR